MRLGGLAQKSSEGRVSLVRGSIGFFALFWFIFWARSGAKAKKNKKVRKMLTA
jgi:hypothetical protein